jgi:hypothetical protein
MAGYPRNAPYNTPGYQRQQKIMETLAAQVQANRYLYLRDTAGRKIIERVKNQKS